MSQKRFRQAKNVVEEEAKNIGDLKLSATDRSCKDSEIHGLD